MDLHAAAAIAADPDKPGRARVDALVQVVRLVSVTEQPIPDCIADAVDDLALVDAAVSRGAANAVCAALHQLGARPELATTRRRVVRRLIAAGVTGISLAGLAAEIGDCAAGASLAVRDFDDHVAARVTRLPPDLIVSSWLSWLAAQPDELALAALRTLVSRDVKLVAVLEHASNPRHADRLHALVRSILPP
ncbi:MAG: hypothetical protein HOV81_35645 [Kofleriaceae bacterium]|nr:hypothetical protein [Kofleriaceae bacterium]